MFDLSGSGQSFSGAPSPPPPLSGLLFGGNMGFSGAGGGDQGGSILGGSRGPGMEAGPGLDILSLLMGGSGGAGEVGGSAIPNISLGQQTGGFPTGLLGQQGFNQVGGGMGQQSIAGQMGGGGGGTQGDLLGLLKSILGVGKAGAGAIGSLFGQTDTTRGDTGGASLSDHVRSGGYQTQGGAASPNIGGLPGTDPFPGMPQDILQALSAGTGYRPDILSPDVQQSLGGQIFGSDSGYQTPGGGGGGGGGPDAEGQGIGGQIGAGAGGLLGLLNLYQGIRGGNPTQAAGGGLQSAGAAGRLLGFPGAGDITGGLGGLLNLAQGIQRGNPSQMAGGAGGSIASLLSLLGEGAAGSVIAPLGLLMSLGLPGNINDLLKAQEKLAANRREISGIQRDFSTAEPTVAGGLGLPQKIQEAMASGDPTQLANLADQATTIINQGPAMARAMNTPQAGPYQSGIPQLPWLAQAYRNAANTYLQAMTRLQGEGALTRTPGTDQTMYGPEGTYTERAGDQYSVGGRRLSQLGLINPSFFTGNIQGTDPGFLQQYQQLFFPQWQG